MTRLEPNRNSWPQGALELGRNATRHLYEHRGTALFSLVAAVAIWFLIQDVENPRVRAVFPPEDRLASIPVSPINADAYIPNLEYSVRVEVEGREDDLTDLTEADFEATVDVKNAVPGVETELPVKVVSHRDGVEVRSVKPATIKVTLEKVETQEFEVRENRSGQLPSGFDLTVVKIEPPKVKVSGLRDDLDRIASVDLDTNLNALTEGTRTIGNDLQARTQTGSEVKVTISPGRAQVTYEVRQVFVQRPLPVGVLTSGQVAAGYRIAGISVEPPIVSASGLPAVMASLTRLSTEPVPLAGATSEIRLIRNLDVQPDITVERRTVTVRIDVQPIVCSAAGSNSPCGPVTIQIGVSPQNQPPNQFVQGTLFVTVQLTGPLAALQTADPKLFKATVNLAAGSGGLYPVTVTVPAALASQGVRAEQPDPIAVVLGPTP